MTCKGLKTYWVTNHFILSIKGNIITGERAKADQIRCVVTQKRENRGGYIPGFLFNAKNREKVLQSILLEFTSR